MVLLPRVGSSFYLDLDKTRKLLAILVLGRLSIIVVWESSWLTTLWEFIEKAGSHINDASSLWDPLFLPDIFLFEPSSPFRPDREAKVQPLDAITCQARTLIEAEKQRILANSAVLLLCGAVASSWGCKKGSQEKSIGKALRESDPTALTTRWLHKPTRGDSFCLNQCRRLSKAKRSLKRDGYLQDNSHALRVRRAKNKGQSFVRKKGCQFCSETLLMPQREQKEDPFIAMITQVVSYCF